MYNARERETLMLCGQKLAKDGNLKDFLIGNDWNAFFWVQNRFGIIRPGQMLLLRC